MLQHKIGGLPVIRGGRVVGIVSTTDLLKALLKVVKATGDILNEQARGSMKRTGRWL